MAKNSKMIKANDAKIKKWAKQLLIEYSDVAKNTLGEVELFNGAPDLAIMYINNKMPSEELFPMLVGEMNDFCRSLTANIEPYGYRASVWGYERGRTKVKIVHI